MRRLQCRQGVGVTAEPARGPRQGDPRGGRVPGCSPAHGGQRIAAAVGRRHPVGQRQRQHLAGRRSRPVRVGVQRRRGVAHERAQPRAVDLRGRDPQP